MVLLSRRQPHETMIPFEEIDRRLDGIRKDRKWLSEASGRKPDSIRVALAPNADPKNRTGLLQKALSDAIEREEEAQAAIQEPPQPGFHNVFLDDEQLVRADLASRKINAASLVDYCRDAIVHRTDEIMAGHEDPVPLSRPPLATAESEKQAMPEPNSRAV